MRVLIIGCGYVGLKLGTELVQRGHQVWGVRRSDRADPELKDAGINPLHADVAVPEALGDLPRDCDWVVLCVSSAGGGISEYERTYLKGAQHLIGWLAAKPPAKLIYTGSTSVYGQTDGSVVEENSPTDPESSTARILVRTEQLLLEAARRGLPAIVLRVGAIYGPKRTYWADQIRSGAAKLDGNGNRILNMIHRDDVVGVTLSALERGRSGTVYNAVDDHPVSQAEFFQWLSGQLLGCFSPAREIPDSGVGRKRGITNKWVSNRKIKEELGYRFKFPTFREGYMLGLD
jgi:nucleoside-diphosphate-sugar epimerase